MAAETNVERLRNAGVIQSDVRLSEEHEKAVNDLTSDDVDAIIEAHDKLRQGSKGDAALGIRTGGIRTS